MPLQNRVHPSGRLEAVAARGTIMGNRGGRIHDPATQTLKRGQPWASRHWLICVLSFKGRRVPVWGKGYSQLFFMDEVTALAAGHRPCFECRRADARAFQRALLDGHGEEAGWTSLPKVDAMDRCLHEARLAPPANVASPADLPIGTMVAQGESLFVVSGHGLLPWSHQGYGAPLETIPPGRWTVMTPAPTIAALRAGFRPLWHPSAQTFTKASCP